MTALLTDNLPLLGGAPNGIRKLRELILELAVRGKLVPQDPSDEPASQLLKRIAGEKARLVAEGKIRKQKPLAEIGEEEKPFELPHAWTWVRLDEVVEVLDSLRKPVTKQDREPGPYPYYGASGIVDYVSNYIFDEPLVLIGEDGAKWGAGEKTAFSISGKTWVNNHAHVVRPIRSALLDEYLVISLVARDLGPFITGTTVPKLNQAKLVSIGVPLPPLAEQHRIVAKVDELMALCDRLEARQADTESAHARLVQALLDSLAQASDAADFAASWQRLSAHFHSLFTSESSIDALKQTLLQLAVMGKLVPQAPSDEPASALMDRLRQERSEWLLSKQDEEPECRTMLRKLSALNEATPPFPLPASWQAVHLIDCSRLLVDCHNKTAPYADSGIPIIRTSNIRNREFRLDDLKYVSEETYEFWSRRCPPEPGDIMFTREAPMGEAAIIPNGAKFCLGQRTMLVRPMHEHIDNKYLLIALTEPHLLERASISAIGSTVKHLRVGDVEQLNIPLPPLAEQHRIVAKLDQLFALCDQLKSRLATARQLHERLAGTLVEQAVA